MSPSTPCAPCYARVCKRQRGADLTGLRPVGYGGDVGAPAPFYQHITITGFRCIKSVELQLTRLHALIGPNDSGKSSILRAVETHWDQTISALRAKEFFIPGLEEAAPPEVRFLRLDPDALRRPSSLIPEESSLRFADERGTGLAGLYDALLSRDRAAFIELESAFRRLFPTVRALRLDNTREGQKVLGLTLLDGAKVTTDEMSEGMLYWLAFAILEHLDPVDLLLVEEPENGRHPSRIREVMQVLRALSERTQIVLATHSPLVINELQPEEVTLITRTPEHGTRATPMTATKNFAKRAEVYALGELWLSYADGDVEGELVP